jgi:mevalonate kinase
VTSDRVGVDLELLNRRTTELTKVSGDPRQTEQVTDELHEILTRLEAELEEPHGQGVQQALLAHQKKLTDAGLKDDKLDKLVHGNKNK